MSGRISPVQSFVSFELRTASDRSSHAARGTMLYNGASSEPRNRQSKVQVLMWAYLIAWILLDGGVLLTQPRFGAKR